MKIIINTILAILTITMLLLLTSCKSDTTDINTTNAAEETTAADSVNVAPANDVAVMQSKLDSSMIDDPFTSYSFEFSNYKDKYIITAELNENHTEIILNVEDNQFNFSQFTITAPDKYMINIPASQSVNNQVCTVIKNTVNNTDFPEILQFDFYLSDFSDDTLPYKVSKFYGISNNKLTNIFLTNEESKWTQNHLIPSDDVWIQTQYTSDTVLYHTEVDVFMPEPVVYTDEYGKLHADVYTYTYDPDNMVMTKKKLNLDFEKANPIYYGYACHAIADYVCKYFTSTCLPLNDTEPYIEVAVTNTDYSDYYFMVDDERFTDVESLREYAQQYFSPKLVDTMLLNAPQKYRDFDGRLYTIAGDHAVNNSLGKLTIVGYIENDDGYTYSTRQEKLDEYGNVIGFADGGDFTITIDENGNFNVTQYRYPYN